ISDIAPLAQLKQLNSLYLSDNKISDIAPLASLIEKGIPVRLDRKYDNKEIVVGENPLTVPPKEIIEQGNQAVLTYLRDLKAGTQQLNEAKLIIVGEPEAGKTTLMEKLLDPDFKPCEDTKSTLGVEVREGEEGWEFPHPKNPERKFTANIWDFGGQQIQYMTHQFFLTPGAVYVLVSANDRKEPTNFPYWFKIIHLLGEERGEYSPVLVVLNEKDDKFINKFNFDKKFYEERYPELQIVTCEVDLSKCDGQYEALRCQVQNMLTRLSHVSNERPAKWADIRTSLQQRAQTHDHISFAEYQSICNQHGVNQEDSQLLFSRYLHKLGSLLHFSEDPKLHNFIILNPQWAVDAVYSVLNDNTIARSGGEFTREQVDQIWKSKTDKNGEAKYNYDERNKLLSLMEKENFEICYRLDDSPERYIAPQLLNTEQPELNWNNSDNLQFRFRYKFMPEGIITRLIVRMNALIADNLVWRKGVVLQGENCRALIQEEENRDGLKVIDIAVSGRESERKFLLREIRKEVNSIHSKWFRNIEAEQMIPCRCDYCDSAECAEPKFFEYSVLQRAQDHGQHEIQCDKRFLNVPVMGLLEGVFDSKELKQERNRLAHSQPYQHAQAAAQKLDINLNLNTQRPGDDLLPPETHTAESPADELPEDSIPEQKQWYKQWWFTSLIPAGVVLFIVGFLTWLWSDSMKWAVTAGLISCAVAYVMVYLNNPARRFFRAAWFVLLGVFAGNISLLSGTFGYAQQGENSNLGLAIKWGDPIHIGLSVALIVLAALLFFFDHWLERNK
ncbi:MAG: COR domain-containing protein, partial [Thiolinea sp.]